MSTRVELRQTDVIAVSVSKHLASYLLSVLSVSLPFPVCSRVGVSVYPFLKTPICRHSPRSLNRTELPRAQSLSQITPL